MKTKTIEEQKSDIIKNHHRMIDGLIYLNKHRRHLLENQYEYLGAPRYFREFGIVRVNLGRGIGSTTYIRNSCKKGEIIVTFNRDLKRELNARNLKNVYTYEECLNFEFKSSISRCPTIWMDDFSYFEQKYGKNGVRELYDNLFSKLGKNAIVIQLG